MSREQARRDAARRFGSAAPARERSYETEIFLWIQTILHDLRYGARGLRSNPLVSTVAILSIPLAIGASTRSMYNRMSPTRLRSLLQTARSPRAWIRSPINVVSVCRMRRMRRCCRRDRSVKSRFCLWSELPMPLPHLMCYLTVECEASPSIDPSRRSFRGFAVLDGDFLFAVVAPRLVRSGPRNPTGASRHRRLRY